MATDASRSSPFNTLLNLSSSLARAPQDEVVTKPLSEQVSAEPLQPLDVLLGATPKPTRP